jgi:hypothetical protein
MQTSSTGVLQILLIPVVRVDHQPLVWLTKTVAHTGQMMLDMGGCQGQSEQVLGRVEHDPFIFFDYACIWEMI